MPYNRRPPAESEESAASVFAPFQPGVPSDAKAKDYANKPLPGDEPAPQRTRVGELSVKQLQEAAERDEKPAPVPNRAPTLSSLVAKSVADQYEPAQMQARNGGGGDMVESKPAAKKPSKAETKADTKPPAAAQK